MKLKLRLLSECQVLQLDLYHLQASRVHRVKESVGKGRGECTDIVQAVTLRRRNVPVMITLEVGERRRFNLANQAVAPAFFSRAGARSK